MHPDNHGKTALPFTVNSATNRPLLISRRGPGSEEALPKRDPIQAQTASPPGMHLSSGPHRLLDNWYRQLVFSRPRYGVPTAALAALAAVPPRTNDRLHCPGREAKCGDFVATCRRQIVLKRLLTIPQDDVPCPRNQHAGIGVVHGPLCFAILGSGRLSCVQISEHLFLCKLIGPFVDIFLVVRFRYIAGATINRHSKLLTLGYKEHRWSLDGDSFW